MSRSRWKVPLCCPRCFETGEAILSHSNDGPADIRVEFLAPAFLVTPSGRTPDQLDILCEHCNISARRDVRPRRNRMAAALIEIRKWIPKLPKTRKALARRRRAVVSHR